MKKNDKNIFRICRKSERIRGSSINEMDVSVNINKAEWEKRSKLWGSTLRSVLFKGLPEVVNEHLHKWHVKIILESIENIDGMRILDVGCGYGRLSLPIIEKFPDVEIVGLDISENYVRLYQKNTKHSAFIGAVEAMPMEFGEFDYIICVTVLMYLNDGSLEKGIINLLLHLKPEGKLIIVETDSSGLPFQTGFGILTLFKNRSSKGDTNTGGRIFRSSEIKELVNTTGGKILSEQRMPFTTLKILPMYVLGKILPKWFTRKIFAVVAFFDRLLEKTKLPSIYVSYIIRKKQN